VGPGDGLLALDRNGDGVINDGSELFGSATKLADGATAGNGYVALAAMDSNHDGKISALDGGFGDLRVWVDANADGVSQAGELKTLAKLRITSLNLDVQTDGSVDHGNIIGLTSSYTTADGGQHAAADVWFKQGMSAQVSGMAQALSAFASDTAEAPRGGLNFDGGKPGVLAARAARMADVLQQFRDADQPATAGLSDREALRLKALQSASSHALLAAPK
jgi:hypothetical protein